ncbi:hypothetical protein U8C35_04170 [Sinorhizobium medicae]|uniref:hypothetical protein n=1 Tax=Sinorhizobium medicae TaxID=110321 RepID=UPI00299F1BD6|nr:hypothetical protein [Sinorhizobium medicae]WQO60879.1 hypothetical protein U8C35_04170 [Sinorhizobium medicae]
MAAASLMVRTAADTAGTVRAVAALTAGVPTTEPVKSSVSQSSGTLVPDAFVSIVSATGADFLLNGHNVGLL